MTVNTIKITSGPYAGNGVADEFSYTFRISDKSELNVWEAVGTSTPVLLTVDTDYTVAGVGVDGGGVITRVAGPLPTGSTWYVRSNFQSTQLTEFSSQGAFFPDVHEDQFDKTILLIQQLEDGLSRTLKLDNSYSGDLDLSLPEPVSQNYLRWKGDLSGLENVDPIELPPGTIVLSDLVGQLENYAAVRALNGSNYLKIDVSGHTAIDDGGGGMFTADPTDAVTTDNGVTVLVDASGLRWKREFNGPIHARWGGVKADGVTDDTTAWNLVKAAAKELALVNKNGGIISVEDCTTIRLTSTITYDFPVSIVGTYPMVYYGGVGARSKGSWFLFDHSGVGFSFVAPFIMGTPYLDKFGTVRNQPTPGPGWAPNPHDFDIVFDNCDLVIGDIMMYNPTKGIRGVNGGAGRLTINTLRGQPLQVGIDLDAQTDAPHFDIIHFWPFWQDDPDVHAYTLANLDCLYFKRVDNPFIQSLFTIFARSSIRIADAGSGTTYKMRVGNMDSDRGVYGIWVDNTSNSNATGQISNFTSQHEMVAGTKAVFIEGTGSRMSFGDFDARILAQNAIRVEGTNNTVLVRRLFVDDYDVFSGGFPAIECFATNVVRIDGNPRIAVSGGGGRYGGAGKIYVDDWRDYTPTVTAGSGTITTLGAVTGKYKRVSNTMQISVDVTITTNGTAASFITVSVPDVNGGLSATLQGREIAVSGKALTGTLGSGGTNISTFFYDNTYPGANGARLLVNGSFQVA